MLSHTEIVQLSFSWSFSLHVMFAIIPIIRKLDYCIMRFQGI